MIKVFTTDASPNIAGDKLTELFESWKEEYFPNQIKIISFHTNSNKYGWCLTIHYELIN